MQHATTHCKALFTLSAVRSGAVRMRALCDRRRHDSQKNIAGMGQGALVSAGFFYLIIVIHHTK